MKSRWGIYLKERFPLLPNLVAAWGMILSCARLALPPGAPVPRLQFAIAFFGGIIFLAQLRFMDELKDFEKDKIAHPERPLPRGLFTTAEFGRFIVIFQSAMILLAILTAIFLNATAGICFGIGTAYLYLMYREFFLGPRLGASPLLYAVTHQIITVPMLAFGFAAFVPAAIFTPTFAWFATLLVTAFFIFEVGRKLDPKAHPLLTTYLIVYGRTATTVVLAVLILFFMLSGERLGLGYAILPLGGLSLLSLLSIWFAPNRFKWVEGWLMLVLLASLWIVPLGGVR